LAKALNGKKVSEDTAKIGIRSARASGRDVSELVAALTTAGGLKTGAKTLTPDELKQMLADVAKLGDPVRGEAVYRRKDQTCMKCHAIGGSGGQVGPGLESLGASAPMDYIIESLLTPNKAVKEGFHSVTVTTTDGKLFTGLKVRETKTELVLRTADDKELTLRADIIDETKPAPSLMPEGLTDTLTRQELVDLVRFLSELGKVGPFAVGKEPVVRTWQILEPTAEAKAMLKRGGVAAVSGEEVLPWSSVYGTVNGVLPLDELSALNDESKTAVVRFKIDVTTAGRVKLKLKGVTGLSLLVDGTAVEVKDETILDLTQGQRVLTLGVDLNIRKEPLRIELDEAAGSTARARLVGGK
jgi:putative heme-binding domain-containing protein